MWSSLWNYLGFKHEDGPYSISEGEDQDEEDEEDLLFIEQAMIKKTLIGKVTRIETDYYLLDDAYYWPKTLVPKINHGRMIKIGDRVSVHMEKREDGQEQFKIVNVQEVLGPEGEDAHGDWNDPEDRWGDEFQGASATESWLRLRGLEADAKDLLSQVGKIVSVSGNQVTLSMQDQSQMTCDWAKLGPEYRPEKGDLLSVRFHLVDSKADVVSVNALRYNKASGDVKGWRRGDKTASGLIDDTTYFTGRVCSSSYTPKNGDFVLYHAVECEPGPHNRECPWRAIRVVPKSSFARPTAASRVDTTASLAAQAALDDLVRDKNGVSVPEVSNLGLLLCGADQTFSLGVTNNSAKEVVLDRLETKAARRDQNVIRLSQPKVLPLSISPGTTSTLEITVHGQNVGHSKDLVALNFGDFKIGSFVEFEVTDPLLSELMPSKPGSGRGPRSNADFNANTQYVPGRRKQAQGGFKPRNYMPRLGEYAIPDHLWRESFENELTQLLDKYPTLGEPLTPANYQTKLSALLHLEEIAMWDRMKMFGMGNVIFQRAGQYLKLEVPGLSEKRPSLMLGDSVIAVKSDEYGAIPHEGVIHTVRSQSVLVAFEQRFQDTYCGEQCDVEFKFNRSQFKRYHHAVEVGIKCMQEEVLFPKSLRHKKPQVDFLTRAQAKAIRRRNRSLEAKQDKVIVLKPSTQSQNNKKKTTTQPDVNSSSGKKNKRRSVAERLFGDQLNDANDNGAPKPDPDLSGYVLPVFPGHVFSVDHPDIPKPSKDWPNYFSMTPGEDTEAKDPIPPYVPRRNKGKKSQIGDRAILSWVNPNLNSEQQSAVCRILSGESRPLPYVIYGPPGTGKTMTLVECILQIFLLRPNSRIMIATPSNSSADLITERLFLSGKVELGDMVRLNAFQRGLDSIPSAVQPFCQANTDVEALGNIVRHRIIVSTCGTAGALYKLGLKNGHFTHCFLDEAGHMTEPETLIPIGLVALNEAQIVLAGDPKQLGPVLQSNFAKLYGLEVSLLERLCARPLYERDVEKFKDHGGYDPLLVTKLVKNYRSHDSIIAIPSLLFYDDELEPMAEETKKGLFLGKTMLPNPQVPIIFHGVKGYNFQEDDSPSWFNPVEALQTVTFLKKLYAEGVHPKDIGVIAPYRKQIDKIRLLLTSLDLEQPKVGSVEEFQGQERPVIIVCTVRSADRDSSDLARDLMTGLGFIQSEKRFNVALTRAQSLLIVLGDPHLLCQDETWQSFIRFCVEKKAYQGCDLPINI